MKRDTAERFAASAVDEVTTKQVQRILHEFLTYLARCPACEDDGTIAFARSATLPLPGHAMNVTAGTVILCPRCGGLDESGNRRHDPEHVVWHCFARGQGAFTCNSERPLSDPEHERCGYQVMLPAPEGP